MILLIIMIVVEKPILYRYKSTAYCFLKVLEYKQPILSIYHLMVQR